MSGCDLDVAFKINVLFESEWDQDLPETFKTKGSFLVFDFQNHYSNTSSRIRGMWPRAQSFCELTFLRNPHRLQVNSPWPSCFALPPLHMCFTYPQLAQVCWEKSCGDCWNRWLQTLKQIQTRKRAPASTGRCRGLRHWVTGIGTTNVLDFVQI